MKTLRPCQTQAIAAVGSYASRRAVRKHGKAWRVFPVEFSALRHVAKHLRKPEDMTSARYHKAKANVRNALHKEMDQLRATNHCPVEFAAACWFRELADLRARVMQPDTYKATGANFRPLLPLWLEEALIAERIAMASPDYFAEQYLLDPSNPFYGAPLLPDTGVNEG